MISTDPVDVAARAQQAMKAKHTVQMQHHTHRFGKLGELQTKKQKQALKADLKAQAK